MSLFRVLCMSFFLLALPAFGAEKVCSEITFLPNGWSSNRIQQMATLLQEELGDSGALSVFQKDSIYVVRLQPRRGQERIVADRLNDFLEGETPEKKKSVRVYSGFFHRMKTICTREVCAAGVTFFLGPLSWASFQYGMYASDFFWMFRIPNVVLGATGVGISALYAMSALIFQPLSWLSRWRAANLRRGQDDFSHLKLIEKLKGRLEKIQNWRIKRKVSSEMPSVVYVVGSSEWAIHPHPLVMPEFYVQTTLEAELEKWGYQKMRVE